MQFLAKRERLDLPPMRLDVRSDIPFASGLGSSGAAIIAGISLGASVCERELSIDKILRYATELEGHADNVATALLGGFVVHCIKADGEVLTIKKFWPSDLKIIAVTPRVGVATKRARRILPEIVSRRNAVYNLQRTALFGAALEQRAYDFLWEATQDRLHQAQRATLVPGLREALAMSRMDGLHAVALSGSGPSVVALASNRFTEIGDLIADCFRKHDLEAEVRVLEVDPVGLRVLASARASK
jgi:homoserine kinase